MLQCFPAILDNLYTVRMELGKKILMVPGDFFFFFDWEKDQPKITSERKRFYFGPSLGPSISGLNCCLNQLSTSLPSWPDGNQSKLSRNSLLISLHKITRVLHCNYASTTETFIHHSITFLALLHSIETALAQ